MDTTTTEQRIESLIKIADRVAAKIQAAGFRTSVNTGKQVRVYVAHASKRSNIEYGYVEVTTTALLDHTSAKGSDGRALTSAINNALVDRRFAVPRDTDGYGSWQAIQQPGTGAALVEKRDILTGEIIYRQRPEGATTWEDITAERAQRHGLDVVILTLVGGSRIAMSEEGEVAVEEQRRSIDRTALIAERDRLLARVAEIEAQIGEEA